MPMWVVGSQILPIIAQLNGNLKTNFSRTWLWIAGSSHWELIEILLAPLHVHAWTKAAKSDYARPKRACTATELVYVWASYTIRASIARPTNSPSNTYLGTDFQPPMAYDIISLSLTAKTVKWVKIIHLTPQQPGPLSSFLRLTTSRLWAILPSSRFLKKKGRAPMRTAWKTRKLCLTRIIKWTTVIRRIDVRSYLSPGLTNLA